MTEWKVNDGYRAAVGDKMFEPGDTFTASDAEVDASGSRPYVTKVQARQQAAPKAANKAVAAPQPHEASTTESSKLDLPDVKQSR